MSLTREQVRHVARLARLALSPEEEERFTRELARILEYVARLQALDVEGVEPSAQTLVRAAPLRPDEARPSLPREEALANAPQPLAGAFGVPRIIE